MWHAITNGTQAEEEEEEEEEEADETAAKEQQRIKQLNNKNKNKGKEKSFTKIPLTIDWPFWPPLNFSHFLFDHV